MLFKVKLVSVSIKLDKVVMQSNGNLTFDWLIKEQCVVRICTLFSSFIVLKDKFLKVPAAPLCISSFLLSSNRTSGGIPFKALENMAFRFHKSVNPEENITKP